MIHPHLSAFHPPHGFVPVRSQLDGVEVYAPTAPDELEQRTRCAACGAGLSWDPAAGAVVCPYCGHAESARAGAVDATGWFTLDALSRGALGWGGARRGLHCDGCGVDLALDPERLATLCPLCGSAQVVARPEPEHGLRPREVLPFAVDLATARARASAWLTAGWLRPTRLAQLAHLDTLQGLYVPYWVFAAQLGADYTVEVGRDRRVVSTDSEGRTTTRTVTDWSWVSGQVSGPSGELAVPATARVGVLDRAGAFPLDQRVPYTPDVLVGFGAQGHDTGLAEGWEDGRAQMRALAATWCGADAGGDRQRNLQAQVQLADERWSYALLPVWTTAFRYRGRTWRVVVNGATGEVGGERPVAWGRVWLAVAAFFTPGLFLGICVGLPGLLFAGLGLVVWVVALVLLVLGGVGALTLVQHALAEEGG